ncbi:hypothetical protein PCC9214_05508 (plasmid) [Planktothrix tepida]|nr:hypothetical protein PCC9214_05508 [Planktothrix tepida]
MDKDTLDLLENRIKTPNMIDSFGDENEQERIDNQSD